jgi:hypothetical protein
LLATTELLVVLFDNIQWGEPTLLQLLEYLADWTGRAPLLVVCLARGALLDERPDWATPHANAEIVSLRPLTAEETRQLVQGLVGRGRVDAEAEARDQRGRRGQSAVRRGEMLRMLAGSGELRSEAGQWVLDRSGRPRADPDHDPGTDVGSPGAPGPEQLQVLERAAVVGQVFGRSDFAALCDDCQAVRTAAHLQASMCKQLISSL